VIPPQAHRDSEDPYADLDQYEFFLQFGAPDSPPVVLTREEVEAGAGGPVAATSNFGMTYALPVRAQGESGPYVLRLLRVYAEPIKQYRIMPAFKPEDAANVSADFSPHENQVRKSVLDYRNTVR
jgi:hypothetical protein